MLIARLTSQAAGAAESTAEELICTGSRLVVRPPKGFAAGPVSIQIQNRGEGGYSAPASATFELSAAP